MKRAAAIVVGAAALVALLGLALGWYDSSPYRSPARLLSANATLSSGAVSFGDPLGARLDLLVDPKGIDVSTIKVRAQFDPYRVAGRTTRATHGDGVLLSYRWSLDCLEQQCLPQGTSSVTHFRPAVVSFRTADGGPGITQVSWPQLRLTSWLRGNETESPAQHLRYDTSLPPPSYAVSPGTLRALLAALCGLLLLAAGVLLWFALRREGHSGPSLSPLQQAIAAVRAAGVNGHVAERRQALGWLGRELKAVEEPELATGASRLAWSRREPTPETAGAFADDVEERN